MEHHDVTGQRFMVEADSMANSTQFKVGRGVGKVGAILRPLRRDAKDRSRSKQKNQECGEKVSAIYHQAGNHFKMSKNWLSAGEAFAKSANYREYPYDSATDHTEAANCYKKVKPDLAIESLLKASEIQAENDKSQIVAKYHEEIGKILEGDGKRSQAAQHYEIAAENFLSDCRNSAANRCRLKAAEIYAIVEEFDQAILIYEAVAPRALESNLLKYTAEDHYFRACICHLCVDFLNAHHALERYNDEYPAFKDCRKAKLLEALIECVQETDIDKYESEIAKYESVLALDSWYKNLLVKIKNNMIVCGYDLC